MDRDKLIKKVKEGMSDKEKSKIIGKLAEDYKDKSDEEIFVEIIKINKEMEENLSPEEYSNMLEKLKSIRPMLSEEQNRKLDLVLKALNKD